MKATWAYLLIAGACEVSWAIGLKYTLGLTRPMPTLLTIVLMLLSFYFLSLAMRQLPLGTAYATWTGIGAAGTAIFGMVYLQEPRSLLRLAFLAGLIICLIGLRLTGDGDN